MKWEMIDPSYGDMIRVALGSIYHFGIYVSDDEVIQFGLPPIYNINRNADDVKVLASDITTFLAGGFLEVCVFDKKEKKKNRTPEETVAYARSKIGMGGYSIIHNNCEHFANSCITGQAVCDQTERIRQMFRNLPCANVFIAPMPDCEIDAPIKSKSRLKYLSKITTPQAKREKYFVWKLLEYALEKSFGPKACDVDFSLTSDGRWVCDGYEISLSHSKNMLAVAVSRAPIGVDIEALHCPRTDKMADYIFTERELSDFSALSEEDKTRHLISAWTAKEAIFKSLHKKTFHPKEIVISDYTLKSGEMENNGDIYIWTVATNTPEILRVYTDVEFI